MAISVAEFELVKNLARTEAGLVLEAGKEYLVESRLQPVARSAGVSLEELFVKLRGTRGEIRDKVIDALTTNETTFFRDVEPFEALRQCVFPDLVTRRRPRRALRIWCGAASTGQEPYSVAMLLKEHFPELADWRVSHLATDLSDDVLDRARSGRYSRLEVNRGLPATYLLKYFDKDATEWVLKPAVRQAVTYDRLNLIKPWPITGPFDLVMLRNVMIYFDTATKRQILEKIRTHLAPDGYLFLGSAETTLGIHDGYERQAWQRTGFYRLAGRPA